MKKHQTTGETNSGVRKKIVIGLLALSVPATLFAAAVTGDPLEIGYSNSFPSASYTQVGAIGYSNDVSKARRLLVVGNSNQALGTSTDNDDSLIVGQSNHLQGDRSMVVGQSNQVLQDYSGAVGRELIVDNEYAFVVGKGNDPAHYAGDVAFVVANGASDGSYDSNALIVYRDGEVVIQQPDSSGNSMEIKPDGKIIIEKQGDVSMGDYTTP